MIAVIFCNEYFCFGKGFAVVSMQKAPVNSLSLEMIQALSKSLTELEKGKCKGFILTSVGFVCLVFNIKYLIQDIPTITFSLLGHSWHFQCWSWYQRNVQTLWGKTERILVIPTNIMASTVWFQNGICCSHKCITLSSTFLLKSLESWPNQFIPFFFFLLGYSWFKIC